MLCHRQTSPGRKLQSVSGELTLARSSSFSVPTSSPGSSSKKGLEGSRGLSALFCYKTERKFSVFSYFSFLSASWVWALHTKDTLDWFTASYKLFKIKSGFIPCLCRSVRGRLWWNCTSNYNIPLKQIPDWITDCDRHVCVNWTETKGPLSTINIKLGLVVLQKSNNQYLSILCASLPPPHANMTQNESCLGAEMPIVALCVRDLWPMTCIYTVCVCVCAGASLTPGTSVKVQPVKRLARRPSKFVVLWMANRSSFTSISLARVRITLASSTL